MNDQAPLSVNTKLQSKAKAMLIGGKYTEGILDGFTKESRVSGLTNGLFSLISLLQGLLRITGPARVDIATRASGFYESTAIHEMLTSREIIEFRIILDRSFKTRQVEYSQQMLEIFKSKRIRTTNTHAKFVLIYNEEWHVCVRTSMNLNENLRCENFDIDNDEGIFNLFKGFVDELFDRSPEGITESRAIVDPIFNDIFSDMTMKEEKKPDQESDFPSIEEQVATAHEFIENIKAVYLPATSINDTTHFFSTEEVFESIKGINPNLRLSKESIYTAMSEAGYLFRPRPGGFSLEMRWLMKRV